MVTTRRGTTPASSPSIQTRVSIKQKPIVLIHPTFPPPRSPKKHHTLSSDQVENISSPTHPLPSVSWSSSPSSSSITHKHQSPIQPPHKLRRVARPTPPSKTSIPYSVSVDSHLNPPISSARRKLKSIENLPLPTSPKPPSSDHDPLFTKETPKPNHAFKPFTTQLPFPNVFSHARHLLRLSSVTDLAKDHLVGRTAEVTKIRSFLAARFPHLFDVQPVNQTDAGKSLYISGPPGTGKSHCINSILLNPHHEVHSTLKVAGIGVHFINCIAMGGLVGPSSCASGVATTSSSIALDDELWRKIGMCIGCKPMTHSPSKSSKKLSPKQLVEHCILNDECQPSIIVLDEIDHLATSKQPLITSLLTLSHQAPNANFTVIGIANTLDLTTRFTWALSPDAPIEPDLIHFSAFDAPDMIGIVQQRLKHLLPSYSCAPPHPIWGSSPATKLFASPALPPAGPEPTPLFHPAALQLCAKRVSAVTGDLRTFLSILRKLIDGLEANHTQAADFLAPAPTSSVLDTPTKMRKFSRIISTSQLLPDLGARSETDPASHFTPSSAPKVTAADVVRYLKTSGALGESTAANAKAECARKLRDLNLHQSLALACLCVAWSRGADDGVSNVSKADAYAVYRTSLGTALKPVSASEWRELVDSGLQTGGLVRCTVASTAPSTPSKRRGGFPRSALCTPTKPKPMASPARSPRKQELNEDSLSSVHSLSVLVECLKSVEGLSEAVLELLNEVLVAEERRVRRSRKRKAEEMKSVMGSCSRSRAVGGPNNDQDEDLPLDDGLVSQADEGDVRD